MPIADLCPECSAPVDTEVHGGLFTSSCTNCSWNESGTVSYGWFEMPRSTTVGVSVLLSGAEASAAGLRELRSASKAAAAMGIQALAQQLSREVSFQVGVFPECLAKEVAQALEGVGFEVVLVEQNVG